MYKIVVGFLFVLLCNQAFGKKLKRDSKLLMGKLDNGLTYYIYPNDYPKGEAIYRLFVKAGSVYEEDDQKGLAHFLEHMAFNGSEHFPSNGMVEFLSSKGARFGADINAHTAMNETVYKLKMPTEPNSLIDSSLMVLADWAGGLTLDSLQIEAERGVILSEWLTKTGPENEINSALLTELLNGSRYSKRLTIGDTAVIKYFTHDRLEDYYNKWYDPSLMAIAITGDVNAEEVERLIRKRFSPIKAVKGLKVPEYEISNFSDVKVKKMSHHSLDKVELSVIQLLDKPGHVEKESDYLAYLQRSLLNRLINARFTALTFNQPAYNAGQYSYFSFINKKGVLMGSVELVRGKIQQGMDEFARSSECIFRYGFVNNEIQKQKRLYLAGLKRRVESKKPQTSSQYMKEIYNDFYAGYKFISIEKEYELAQKYINKVDSVSLIKLLQGIRKPEETHYLLTSFDKVKEEVPDDQTLVEIFSGYRTADIEPYELNIEVPDELLADLPEGGRIIRREKIPAIDGEMINLSNGASVLFKHSDRSPGNIQISGFRKGGLYALDSLDYVTGLFTGSAVSLSGAGDFSREALSHYLAGRNSSMRLIIEKTRSGLVGQADLKNVEEMFQLLYLKWTSPKMDTAVFNQLKEKAIESYLTRNETDADRFRKSLNKLLVGENYTNREISDKVLNEELKAEKVLDIYHSNFGSAKDFQFVILGDCQPDSIIPYIQTYIGGLSGEQVSTDYIYSGPELLTSTKSIVENASDNPRSTISLIFQNNQLDGQLHRVKLKHSILSGVVRTRLLQTLREQMGMVYSVGVSAGCTRHPSPLNRMTIQFQCKPDDVDTLIARTKHELNQMLNQPEVMEKSLDDVKKNLVNKWNKDIQKNTYWSISLRNALFNQETDWDYLMHYDEVIGAISKEDIASEIKSFCKDSPLVKAILNPKKTELDVVQKR